MKVEINIVKTININVKAILLTLLLLIGAFTFIKFIVWGVDFYHFYVQPALLYNNEEALTNSTAYECDSKVFFIDEDKDTGMEDEERTKYVFHAQSMQGVETLWYYQAEQDEVIKISYLLSAPKGKAKLVYVSPSWKTTTLAEKIGEESDELVTTTLAVKKGENRIKLACGFNTEIHMKLQIKEGWFQHWKELIGEEWPKRKPITSTLPQ